MEYSIKPKRLGERGIIHYPQKRIIGLYVNEMFKIEKSLSRANIPKTIPFTDELDAKLTKVANGEQISFNELVLRCCQYALSEYEGDIDIKETED